MALHTVKIDKIEGIKLTMQLQQVFEKNINKT